MKLKSCFLCLLVLANFANAQILADKVYDESTQTVLLYNSKIEQSLPIISLNTN